MPDAAAYGDVGSDTLGHVAAAAGGLHLPAFQRLGLGNLHKIEGVPPLPSPEGFYGKMSEQSAGKDTTTGHWEMAGLVTRQAFPLYPQGFPPDVVEAFEKAIGRKMLGNKAASGTEIIAELGEEHMRTGNPIVYTSGDSVFQIACHEDVVSVDELYRWSKIAREIMRGPHNVSRIIARPFVGTPGNFTRTPRRKDFSVLPHGETCLDRIVNAGRKVIGVGKIKDIFAGKGISDSHHMEDNLDGLKITRRLIETERDASVIFTNLVDFDMKYGHRNDAAGYAKALLEMDQYLPQLLDAMQEGDVLFITADHGCDPCDVSTDHTREYVPILAWGRGMGPGRDLGIRSSFGDMGATILEGFGLSTDGLTGESFAGTLWKELAAC
jgi:phosphopentomutase